MQGHAQATSYGTVRFCVKQRFLDVRKRILADQQPGHPNSPAQKLDRLRNSLLEIIQNELDRIGVFAYRPMTAKRILWQGNLYKDLSWMLVVLPPALTMEEMYEKICEWVTEESKSVDIQPRNKRWLHERVGRILDLCDVTREADRASFFHHFVREFGMFCRTLEMRREAASIPARAVAGIDTIPALKMSDPKPQPKRPPEQFKLKF